MVKTELIKRSPLRILERSLHGGLKPGEIGVLTGKKGIGKTACLVHVATDKLFQGKHVIHISYAPNVHHLIDWYEDIFKEIARKRNLENAMDVHEEIIRNRVILNFHKEGAKTSHVVATLRALKEGGAFDVDQVIVDGYEFTTVDPHEFALFKEVAEDLGISFWFSASTGEAAPEVDEGSFPKLLDPVKDMLDVVLLLLPGKDGVTLHLVKDRDRLGDTDLHLVLDPKTLLISEED
ncbi:cytoplasmic protein [Spirochaeta thermophila DSM 6578]|uniref:Cytoplasmic protein n=1 Tax=Winmispira thermophila (strain ATCC 700085 / DSM 6578 / Z-1203) TaxID=869211 RepID=G0GDS4_WINT7|nr:hypothetical protein [Spirochaeta thermophila]AEJ62204.1 cytoplasmic protein [Spirochaeta thermophila DSM 6578]